MAKRIKLEVGNQVYVKTDNGHGGTIYEITKLFPGGGCLIKQWGTCPVNGKTYSEQRYDTSLLTKKKGT